MTLILNLAGEEHIMQERPADLPRSAVVPVLRPYDTFSKRMSGAGLSMPASRPTLIYPYGRAWHCFRHVIRSGVLRSRGMYVY